MPFRGCKAWQQAGPLQTRRPEESRPTGYSESSSIRSSSFEALPSFRDEPESDRNPNGLLRQSLLATDRVTFGVLPDKAVLENARTRRLRSRGSDQIGPASEPRSPWV